MQGGYPSGSYPPDPNVPQPPPDQGPQPQQQPVTLGQANGDPSGLPPGNPYLEQFLQMHQALDQIAQPLKQPLQPPQPGPGILESLGTFGIANLKHIADENTRREENYKRHQHNLAIDQHTNDMALKATDTQATAAGLQGRASLAQQGMALRLMQYQQQLNEYAHKLGREQVADEVPLPTTPEGADMAAARGLEVDPQHPNRMRLRQNPQTGAWEPPKAGSAAQSALDAVGGGGQATAGGGAADGPRPGESPQGFARRQSAAAKGAEKTTTEDAAAAAETMRNMKLVESWLKDPMFDRAVSDLPNQGLGGIAESAAGPAVAYLKRRTGSPGAAYLGTANTNVMPALRAMEAGAKNMRIAGQVLGDFGVKKQMTQLQNYRMSQPEAQQFKKTLLDRFKQIRNQLGTGDQSDSGNTTDTATSGGPPSTVGGPTQGTPSTGVTPNGIRFRVVGQ